MVDLTELPPKNHNNPPSALEILGEDLTLRNVHIIRAAETHVNLAGNIPDHFMEEKEAAFVTGFIKLMQNCQKELERRRVSEKEPFLASERYVDKFFNDPKNELERCIKKATAPLQDWLQRKADKEKSERDAEAAAMRREQESALARAASMDRNEVTAAEAANIIGHAVTMSNVAHIAETIAAAPLVTMARTVAPGASAGLGTVWVGTIKNIDELDLTKLRPYIGVAELQKALDRYVKQGGRKLEGAEIKEEIKAKVK